MSAPRLSLESGDNLPSSRVLKAELNSIKTKLHKEYKLDSANLANVDVVITTLLYLINNINSLKGAGVIFPEGCAPVHLENHPEGAARKKSVFNSLVMAFINSFNNIKSNPEHVATFCSRMYGYCIDGRTRWAFDYALSKKLDPTFGELLNTIVKSLPPREQCKYFQVLKVCTTTAWEQKFEADLGQNAFCREKGAVNRKSLPLICDFLKTILMCDVENDFLPICFEMAVEKLPIFFSLILEEPSFIENLELKKPQEQQQFDSLINSPRLSLLDFAMSPEKFIPDQKLHPSMTLNLLNKTSLRGLIELARNKARFEAVIQYIGFEQVILFFLSRFNQPKLRTALATFFAEIDLLRNYAIGVSFEKALDIIRLGTTSSQESKCEVKGQAPEVNTFIVDWAVASIQKERSKSTVLFGNINQIIFAITPVEAIKALQAHQHLLRNIFSHQDKKEDIEQQRYGCEMINRLIQCLHQSKQIQLLEASNLIPILAEFASEKVIVEILIGVLRGVSKDNIETYLKIFKNTGLFQHLIFFEKENVIFEIIAELKEVAVLCCDANENNLIGLAAKSFKPNQFARLLDFFAQYRRKCEYFNDLINNVHLLENTDITNIDVLVDYYLKQESVTGKMLACVCSIAKNKPEIFVAFMEVLQHRREPAVDPEFIHEFVASCTSFVLTNLSNDARVHADEVVTRFLTSAHLFIKSSSGIATEMKGGLTEQQFLNDLKSSEALPRTTEFVRQSLSVSQAMQLIEENPKGLLFLTNLLSGATSSQSYDLIRPLVFDKWLALHFTQLVFKARVDAVSKAFKHVAVENKVANECLQKLKKYITTTKNPCRLLAATRALYLLTDPVIDRDHLVYLHRVVLKDHGGIGFFRSELATYLSKYLLASKPARGNVVEFKR